MAGRWRRERQATERHACPADGQAGLGRSLWSRQRQRFPASGGASRMRRSRRVTPSPTCPSAATKRALALNDDAHEVPPTQAAGGGCDGVRQGVRRWGWRETHAAAGRAAARPVSATPRPASGCAHGRRRSRRPARRPRQTGERPTGRRADWAVDAGREQQFTPEGVGRRITGRGVRRWSDFVAVRSAMVHGDM